MLKNNNTNLGNIDFPLMEAIKNKHHDTALELIRLGADVNWRNSNGCSLLHVAARVGNTEIIATLLGKDDVLKSLNMRPLNIEDLKKNGFTPLVDAIWYKQNDTALELMRLGANVNWRNSHDRSLLHIAAQVGNKDILSLINKHGSYSAAAIFHQPDHVTIWFIEYGVNKILEPITVPISKTVSMTYKWTQLGQALKQYAEVKIAMEIAPANSRPSALPGFIQSYIAEQEFFELLPDFDRNLFIELEPVIIERWARSLRDKYYKELTIPEGKTIIEAIKEVQSKEYLNNHIDQASVFISGVAMRMFNEDCAPTKVVDQKQLDKVSAQISGWVSKILKDYNNIAKDPIVHVDKPLRSRLAIGIENAVLTESQKKSPKRKSAVERTVKKIIEEYAGIKQGQSSITNIERANLGKRKAENHEENTDRGSRSKGKKR